MWGNVQKNTYIKEEGTGSGTDTRSFAVKLTAAAAVTATAFN